MSALKASDFRMLYDIHTHTTFSHGKGSIEDNVQAAIALGLAEIGIADHGPGHLTYGVKHENFRVMRQEIERLKPLYPQIRITLGVEANIINPSGTLDIWPEEWTFFDYVLAGYHYGIFGEAPVRALRTHTVNLAATHLRRRTPEWGAPVGGDRGQRKENTDLVVKALHENRIRVLTHPGDKGRFDLQAIAAACEETGTLMEISTWHEAPLTDELRHLAKRDVQFIVSSDAHTPDRVGTFLPGLERALEAGIDPERIVNLAGKNADETDGPKETEEGREWN